MANLITRRAARHWGNLMVPIKRLAAAQSNYGETGGPVTGTGWGLSSFLGQGRDLWEGCPHLSISPLPCLPLRGAPSCSQQSLASRCEAGALPQVHPGAFFPYECPFAGAWSICSSEKNSARSKAVCWGLWDRPLCRCPKWATSSSWSRARISHPEGIGHCGTKMSRSRRW